MLNSSILLSGTIAPLFKLNALLGIIRSSSIFCLKPRPLHSGHAPNGELNENILGSNSAIEKSQ